MPSVAALLVSPILAALAPLAPRAAVAREPAGEVATVAASPDGHRPLDLSPWRTDRLLRRVE